MSFFSSAWHSLRDWVTDWYDDKVFLQHIDKIAEQNRQPIIKGQYTADTGPIKDKERLDAFMFSGADFKGQIQHGFDTLGYGGSASVTFDFAKMFVPPPASAFVSLSTTGSVAGKYASHRFMCIAHQGARTELGMSQNTLDEFPVLLTNMIGGWKYIKSGIGASAGAKLEIASFMPVTIGDVEAFNVGISATASATGSWEGTWVQVSDTDPLCVPRDRHQIQGWLQGQGDPSNTHASGHNPHCYLTWYIQGKEAGAGIDAKGFATAATNLGKVNGNTLGPGGQLTLSAKLPSIKWTSKASTYRLNLPTQNPEVVCSQEAVITYKQIGGQLLSLALDFELGPASIKEGKTYDGQSTSTPSLVDPQSLSPDLTQKVDAKTKVATSRLFNNPNNSASKAAVSESLAPGDLEFYKGQNLKIAVTSKSLKMGLAEEKLKSFEKKWETVNSMGYVVGIAYWKTRGDNTAQPQKVALPFQERRQNNFFVETDRRKSPFSQVSRLSEGSGLIRGQSLTLSSLIKLWANEDQCEILLTNKRPAVGVILQKAEELINAPSHQGLGIPGQMPRYEEWHQSTETGDWRRAISSADTAVKDFWKHMDKQKWSLNPYQDLITKSGVSGGNTAAQAKGVIGYALKEISDRVNLYKNILSAIEKWVLSKGDIEGAMKNSRAPGAFALREKCTQFIKDADSLASKLDVLRESLEVKLLIDEFSASLFVSTEDIDSFLSDTRLKDLVKDLINGDKKQIPGAFLLEAAFKLNNPSSITPGYKPDIDDIGDFTALIEKGTKDLQSLSLRYRKADTLQGSRTFKLGVNVGAAALGFSIDRVRQAGTEGTVMLHTKWFGSFSAFSESGGWPEKAVPMPTLLS